ncbi:MAG: transglutaminase domain-containing protein, partial [Planctomycetota bacterium]
MRRTTEGYAIPAVRGGLAVCLLAGAAAYGVGLRDPVGTVAFAALLLLPGSFPLFVAIRRTNPTFAAGMLGLSLLLPIPDYIFLSGDWTMAFAHLAMLLAVWKFQSPRLVGGDCRFLLGLSVFLAVLSTDGARDGFFAPLLALYSVSAVATLTVLTLRLEEERILDLARVRGYERPEAREVAGRKGTGRRAVIASLRHLSFWLIAGGFVIWWVTPHVISGVGGVFDFILHGDRVAIEDPLPELPDEGPAPFALPPDIIAPEPFGPRLERDEFLRRKETDELALLVRPKPGSSAFTRDLRIRGECYDALTDAGRWIRARGATRTVFDGEDGTTDGAVEVLPAVPGVVVDLDYLVPAGRDRTLYACPVPVKFLLPRVVIDGVGNHSAEQALAVARPYSVRTSFHEPGPAAILADPGPEFRLIPAALDRERLDAIVFELTEDFTDPAERVSAILTWLRRAHIRYEEDERVVGVEETKQTAPPRVDVDGFLFERKWGRDIDFASAGVVLLRAAGVPCRLATGYFGDWWLADSGFFVFRTPDAAVWVEVPFEGLGWVPFEAVPEAVDILPPEKVDEIFEAPEEERAEEAAAALEEAKKPSLLRRVLDAIDKFVSGLVPGGANSTTVGRLFAWLIVIVGILLLGWAAVRGSRRAAAFVAKGRGLVGKDAARFPFYERLVRALSTLGYRRRPAETPLEFARAVIRSEGPELDDVEGLTRIFCGLRYGEGRASPEQAMQLTSRVSAVERWVDERRRRPAPGSSFGALVLLLAAWAGTAGAQTMDDQPEPDVARAIEDLGSPVIADRRGARKLLIERGAEVVPDLLEVFVDPEETALDERIARRIDDLDHDDFNVREQATRDLDAIGEPARVALDEALRRGSAETRHRARGILDRMRAPTESERESRRRAVALRRGLALRVLARIAHGPDLSTIAVIGISRPELRGEVVHVLAAVGRRHPADVMRLMERPRPEVARLVAAAVARWP